ncbi:expressed unknown protein [Seminavis robusta]|uniref:Uncharacterized protein n=1 Tax=Seminavis robusta TaxID=568900 RepID=A0A9N8HPY3_9STRA|nr:expressed unknown protein [Seminavis robusta]|eukprot:Sro1140_g245530.1 n/a (333) ;mRNA; f:19601-20599
MRKSWKVNLGLALVVSGCLQCCSGFSFQNALQERSSSALKISQSFEGSAEDIINSVDSARRSMGAIALASLVGSFVQASPALASDVRGPIELLRPATRIKLYIDNAIELCQAAKTAPQGAASLVWEPLREFLAQQPASFMTPDELKLSTRYLEIDTNAAWQAARRKEREEKGKEIGIDYTTPYDRLNTSLQQWGDQRTFQILRGRQRNLERNNAMRAAFNAYTNNLVFGDSYQLNVQGAERKALVRNDALPDVNTVVVSDLDLRDLYRNQVLQNMDDAKAEIDYQISSGEVDVNEVLACLQAARASCDEWFSFIPKEDVQAALQDVLSESRA